MTGQHFAGDRHACPRCGRELGLTFGGVRLPPHVSGRGGPACEGSRMPVEQVLAEHAARAEVTS